MPMDDAHRLQAHRVELALKRAEVVLADCKIVDEIACTDPAVRMNERDLILGDGLDVEDGLLQCLESHTQLGQTFSRQRIRILIERGH